MVEILINIKEINKTVPIFKVDSSVKNIKEIAEAIDGEYHYNKSILDFGGLIYE